MVKEFGEASESPLSFNYVIKNFNNLKLNDKDILDLDVARKKLKQGETKYIQFHSQSRSRSRYPHPLYKALYFSHCLTYMNVNHLFNMGYFRRLQGLRLMKARQNNNLPYILFKDGAIQVNTLKLYKLILLTLLYIGSFYFKNQIKYIYRNKENENYFYTTKKINIKNFNINRIGLSYLKVRTLYTVINI